MLCNACKKSKTLFKDMKSLGSSLYLEIRECPVCRDLSSQVYELMNVDGHKRLRLSLSELAAVEQLLFDES